MLNNGEFNLLIKKIHKLLAKRWGFESAGQCGSSLKSIKLLYNNNYYKCFNFDH